MVAVPTPAPEAQLETESVQRYLAALQEIPLVERISYTTTPGMLHIWVLFSVDDVVSFRQAIDAEVEMYRALKTASVDLHYHSIDTIRVDMLPPSTIIFARN
jgi:hypothetical protein